jgi:hypothetical protein
MSDTQHERGAVVRTLAAALATLKAPFQADEVTALGAHELDRVMHELGMTCADLDPANPESASLLPAMLGKLGLASRADIAPAVLRDLERTCSRCAKAGTCRSALEQAGIPDYEAFCNNADVLVSLDQARARLARRA